MHSTTRRGGAHCQHDLANDDLAHEALFQLRFQKGHSPALLRYTFDLKAIVLVRGAATPRSRPQTAQKSLGMSWSCRD